MDKDNEIYVTSNGELYKKGVKQAINPQTNYTTQQFYTKEEYEKLQQENDNLKDDIDKQQLYVDSLEQENERLKAENELIKERSKELYTFSATYENDKLKQALQEIRDIAERQLLITNVRTYQMVYYADFYQYRNEILTKINEVIGAEE